MKHSTLKHQSNPLWSRRGSHFAGLATACAVALMTAFVLLLGGCGGGGGGSSGGDLPTVVEANIDTLATQIGGGTQDVELYNDGTSDWTLYTMANRFAATPVGMGKGAVTEIKVPDYIQHITVVAYGGKSYALLSMGGKGIGVVDITNPAAMRYVRTMRWTTRRPSSPIRTAAAPFSPRRRPRIRAGR